MKTYWVYILTNKPRGVFYVGCTIDPAARLKEHLSGKGAKHVKRYGLDRLVWFQAFAGKDEGLSAEHRMKRWKRDMKIQAVERMNPDWRDLSREWLFEAAGELDL